MTFVLVHFQALKRKPVICKSDNTFRFSRFLVPSQQRNHRKSFYCYKKYFTKENFRATAWTSTKCCCRNKMGNPERAVLLHLACLGSQSQCAICFILPAHRACHMIIKITSVTNLFTWLQLYPLLPRLQEKEDNVMKSVEEILQYIEMAQLDFSQVIGK